MRVDITYSQPLWWVPHDLDRYDYGTRETGGWRYNPNGDGKPRRSEAGKAIPEVYRVWPAHDFRLTEPWQDLICSLNPWLSREDGLALLGEELAFTNNQWGVVDAVRVMGGWVVTGTPRDGVLWLKTLRVDQPCPPVSKVLEDRTLWGWCVGVQPDGDVNLWWRRGMDGLMHRVRFYLVSTQPVFIPLDELLRLPDGFIPDPQWHP